MVIKEGRTVCLVCGYDFKRQVLPEDDCSCCGVFQGYFQDSDRPEHIKECREYWLETENAKWDEGEEYAPEGWNKEMALKQIKDNVPEEFQQPSTDL